MADLELLLGIFEDYVFLEPTELVLKEKLFSLSDNLTVRDKNGISVIKCQGHALGRKDFKDTSGRLLFTLQPEPFALRKAFKGINGKGKRIFTVQKRFRRMCFLYGLFHILIWDTH